MRHGSETLAAALSSPLAVYRCPNKKAAGYAVYTNIVPGGGFRGYGASQTTFAIESAMDELAGKLGLDPFAIRRTNMVRPGDWMESIWSETSDVGWGSYGLDQCMDWVEQALRSGRGEPKPDGDAWLEGQGVALAMLECGRRRNTLGGGDEPAAGRALPSGRRLDRDGQWLRDVAPPDRGGILGCAAHQIDIINADTTARPMTPAPSPAPAPSSRARRWR